MSNRVLAAFAVIVTGLFLIANRAAYRGFFSDDDLDNIANARGVELSYYGPALVKPMIAREPCPNPSLLPSLGPAGPRRVPAAIMGAIPRLSGVSPLENERRHRNAGHCMSRRRKPEELRSHRWFGASDMRQFGHHSRAAQMGYSRRDYLGKPMIAIINTWSDINACHAHFRQRAEEVKRGVLQAGGFPLEMPAIALAEVFQHGAAGGGALAEVTPEQAGHVAPVLDGYGPVEAHPALDLRHVLGRGEGPRLDEGGVARQQVGQRERDERHPEERRDDEEQALEDVAAESHCSVNERSGPEAPSPP